MGATGIEDAILAKTIDVGILLGHLKPILSGIPIMDSPLCLLSRKETHWKGRKSISLIELKEESFLLYADTFSLNHMIIRAANDVGFEPKVHSYARLDAFADNSHVFQSDHGGRGLRCFAGNLVELEQHAAL